MSSFRRRMMMAVNNNSPSEDYIQDGLMFHLDCADYNSTLNTWVDKIGNISFTMSNVTVDSLGGIKFNGTLGSKGVANVGLNCPLNSSTIEVAIVVNNKSKSHFILDTGVNNTINYGFLNNTNQGMCAITTTANLKPYHIVGIDGFIANSLHYGSVPLHVLNGSKGRFSGSTTYWSKNGTTATLGNRNNNNQSYSFNGTIYQIRIYNRHLTEVEMIYNQQIDMRKYNSN